MRKPCPEYRAAGLDPETQAKFQTLGHQVDRTTYQWSSEDNSHR